MFPCGTVAGPAWRAGAVPPAETKTTTSGRIGSGAMPTAGD